MKKLILIVCLIGLSGCGVLALSQIQVVRSSLGRMDPSPAARADVPAFTAGEQDFAFDLYRKLSSQPGNLLFSPHSLYLNLVMDSSGARADTASQMASVLHLSLPQERLHAAANALDQDLAAAGSGSSPIQLSVANSLWAQKDFSFTPAYLDLLAQNYGAGIRMVDFKQSGGRQQAAAALNQWSSDQTHGKISSLVDPQSLTDLTRLLLASTIYFNAEWKDPFLPSTSNPPFILKGGTPVMVPFINSHRFDSNGHSIPDVGIYQAYHYKKEVTLVEVPYKGGRVSFVGLLPDPGYSLEALEASLSAEKLQALLTAPPTYYKVYVEMPKFSFETSLELSGALAALGMPDAFNEQLADFSGMNGKQGLLISSVAQKATIRLDERGTEAASASVTGFRDVAMEINIRLDHPFLFLILDRSTGAILFLGRMEDPR